MHHRLNFLKRILIVGVVMRVNISSSCLKKIKNHIQYGNKKESGGVLLGKFIEDTYFINDITEPQLEDKATRNTFFRSSAHNILVEKLWKESSGEITYIGLWHTHPEECPMYSNVDEKDWMNALKNSIYESEGLIFLILGTKSLNIWYGEGDKLVFVKDIIYEKFE